MTDEVYDTDSFNNGYAVGLSEGYQNGADDGYEAGYDEGYREGRTISELVSEEPIPWEQVKSELGVE